MSRRSPFASARQRPARAAWVAAALLCAATALTLTACGDGTPSDPQTRVTKTPPAQTDRYYGIAASEVLPQSRAKQEETLASMVATGFGLMRQTFQWYEIEPSKGRWSFGMHDQFVESAARAGIEVMPVVFNVRPDQRSEPKPGVKITKNTTMPPKDPQAFAEYATVLVKRYGRGGTFWKEHPDIPQVPPTAWQIWNEPNLKAYWGGRPNEKEYAELLRVTSEAIRKVDPKAEIVTGGVPESRLGIPLSDYVSLLVKAGAEGSFDTLAIHPYSRTVDGVIAAAADAREILDRSGLEDVNLWITEVGWATGDQKSDFTVSEGKQAELVSELLQRTANLAEDLKLRGVIYYGWRDVDPPPGDQDFWGWHTGLLRQGGKPKPAHAAYTQAAAQLKPQAVKTIPQQ